MPARQPPQPLTPQERRPGKPKHETRKLKRSYRQSGTGQGLKAFARFAAAAGGVRAHGWLRRKGLSR